MARKYARQHYEVLKEHIGHDVTLDFGDGEVGEEYGFWCDTCDEAIGKYARP